MMKTFLTLIGACLLLGLTQQVAYATCYKVFNIKICNSNSVQKEKEKIAPVKKRLLIKENAAKTAD